MLLNEKIKPFLLLILLLNEKRLFFLNCAAFYKKMGAQTCWKERLHNIGLIKHDQEIDVIDVELFSGNDEVNDLERGMIISFVNFCFESKLKFNWYFNHLLLKSRFKFYISN